MKRVPFEFIFDHLPGENLVIKPMFGLHAVYSGGKMVLMLRERGDRTQLNGIWVAVVREYHKEIRCEIPALEPLVYDEKPSMNGRWLLLPMTARDFESSALRLSELIAAADRRIGKS